MSVYVLALVRDVLSVCVCTRLELLDMYERFVLMYDGVDLREYSQLTFLPCMHDDFGCCPKIIPMMTLFWMDVG